MVGGRAEIVQELDAVDEEGGGGDKKGKAIDSLA
jgi:hypothetical protein